MYNGVINTISSIISISGKSNMAKIWHRNTMAACNGGGNGENLMAKIMK
jgi:hypothetical protein